MSTIYTTLSAGSTAAQINSAIASCPSNQVVKLGPGTFNIGSFIDLKSGVVLRGSGRRECAGDGSSPGTRSLLRASPPSRPGSRNGIASYQRIFRSVPATLHRSTRFVQHPSSTCCESITSFSAGCRYEYARPPTYGLRSSSCNSGPAADLLPYVTSKGALVALARALAMAHGPDGIAVTCVAPGLTDTPAARAGLPAAAFDAVRARPALPRALRPDDVAATVAFLASDGAAALTGQVLCTDGGLVMR